MTDVAKLRILLESDSSGVVRGLAPGRAAMTTFEGTARTVTRNVAQSFRNLTAGKIGLGQFAAEVKRAGNDIDGSFLKISNRAKLMGGAALGFGALAVAVGKSIGPAIQFESAFAGVRKTVDGTEPQLMKIRDGLLGMSKVMPTSADQLASIAENAGQLGVAAPDVLEFTRTIAMLGETTDLDFDEASQSLARFLNITGDGAGAIETTADIIVELGNNSATTESQIVAMATRLASAFTAAGANQQEILGIAAALSSVGIEAEAGGTAASQAITKLTDAAKMGGNELRTYAKVAGVLPEEFARIAEQSPVEALVLFTEGLGRMSEAGKSVTPVLDELDLSGIRVRRALESMGLASGEVRKALGLAEAQFERGGAAAEEYGKRVETTASRIAILKNRINTIAVEVGTPFLDGVVAAVDGLGDGIEALVDEARPLGVELVEFFSNAGESAELFMDVIGGPALKAFFATISGGLQIAAGLLDMFNGLGSAGPPLAAVLAILRLYPGVLATATSSAAAFTTSLHQVGVGGTAAAGGMRALQAAASVGPLIAVTGVLAAVGAALYDAKEAAREAGAEFEKTFQDAVDTGNFAEIESTVSRVKERIQELDDLDQVPEGLSASFSGWGASIKSVAQIVTPFTENTIVNARAEMEELQRIMDESGANAYEEGIRRLAVTLGLTSSEVAAIAKEQGLYNEVVEVGLGQSDLWAVNRTKAAAAIAQEAAAMAELSEATGLAIDRILQGDATMQDFTEAVGVSASSIEFLVNQIDGIELDDLVDPDKMAEAYSAIDALNDSYKAAAAQIGVTTDQIYEQVGAVYDLAASHSELRQTIDGTKSALELMEDQQRRAAEAGDTFSEALSGIGEVGGLEAAARAMRDLSLETAGTGISASEASAAQQRLYESFLDAAVGAGIAEEEARDVAIALGLVPDETLAYVTVDGQEAKKEAGEVQDAVERTAGNYDVVLGAVDNASMVIAKVDGEAKLFPNRYEAELAVRDAASAKIQGATDDADDFDGTYTARVEVDDQATRDLSIIQAYLDRMPNQKTITVSTITRSSGGSTVKFQADGGIMGRVQRFAEGGFTVEKPGTANIYAPTSRYRVFAEPETGGEAYIPLAPAKRPRSMAILRETARLMGAEVTPMADGGIMRFAGGGISTRQFSNGPGELPTIVVDVAIDAESVGRLETDLSPANAALRDVTRNLDEATVSVDRMGAVFQNTGVEIVGVAEEAGRGILASFDDREFLDVFERVSGWGRESFLGFMASVDDRSKEMVDELRADGASIEEIFTEVFSAEGAVSALEDAGYELRHIFRQVFYESADQVEVLDAALGVVAGSMGDVEDATRRADDAFRLLHGSGLDLLDQQIQYLDAVDRVKEAIAGDDEGAGVFGLVGAEARRNYQDLVRAGDAMREYGLEIAGSGVSAGEALREFNRLRAEFRELATDTGLPQAEVKKLLDLLFGVPPRVITAIAVEGQQAQADVAALDGALTRLGNKQVRPAPKVNADEFHEGVSAANKAIEDLDGKTATTVVQNTIRTTTTSEYKGGTYTIQKGDSWWAMAAKLWGDPTRYRELAAKNNADPSKTIYPGQVIKFAAGGIDAPNRHEAGIHKRMRVFAEPETGGEAYIPLANDWRRARALEVWKATGNALGVQQYAAGGIRLAAVASGGGGVTIHAPVDIAVTGSGGGDDERLASMIEGRVRSALEQAGRELANMRR